MLWGILAELTFALHIAFVLFVVLGGLWALRTPKVALLHLPLAAYGVAIEWIGWVCPLTPLERRLRIMAGGSGFEGGFLEHYLGPVLYPGDWEALRWWLGGALLAFNAIIYWRVVRRWRADRT